MSKAALRPSDIEKFGLGLGLGLGLEVELGDILGVGDEIGFGLAVGDDVACALEMGIPLPQVNFLPFFIHVNFFPLEVCVNPSFLHANPVLGGFTATDE